MRWFWRVVGMWVVAVSLLGARAGWTQMPVPALTGHVVDLTQTLSPDQKNTLEQALTAFESSKGSQLAVLMVSTVKPEAIEPYAMRVAEQWKLGRKKIDDGAILIVAKEDRTVRIEVGYGLEGVLNDATCKRIIDEIIVPRFRQQDFAGGVTEGLQRMMSIVKGEPLPPPARGTSSSEDSFHLITLIIVVGAIAGFVLRAIVGKVPGALATGVVVGLFTWFILGALSLALIAGTVTLFTTLIGATGLLRARYGDQGGPGGRGGGGFRGGGGGFGGGGASGRW
jgi:uncharacterized protein